MSKRPRSDDRVKSDILSRKAVTITDCWEYKGHKDSQGYGQISYNNKSNRVHRIFYFIHVGGFDLGNSQAQVLHKCDNPSCFNPEHLFLGTSRDNNLDARIKGRWRGR